MRSRPCLLALFIVAVGVQPAFPVAQQIGAGDTALLFGGIDAEGGIGDWYLSNGVVEAIIDDVGLQADLVGVVPPASVPPVQTEFAFTGGTLIDLGRAGANDDQLSQVFTVGGLSTANFLLYDTVSAPSSDTIRASGGILLPPTSIRPNPCLDVVTDYTAAGSDPFITVTSTATNNCGVTLSGFGGVLDIFIWTQRSIVPFSSGGSPPVGGRGFNHPALDLANPASVLEVPAFVGGPGALNPADGLVDPANGTTCGEVSYGLVGVETQLDQDGPGGSTPVTTPVNLLLGATSTTVSALGNFPGPGLQAGGTFTYRRRIYVGTRNDVRSVSDGILAELAARMAFSTGTISGDVDAADTANVEASILVTRVGLCQAETSLACKATTDCGPSGPCVDPVPTAGQGLGAAVTQIRTDAAGAFSGVVLPRGNYTLLVSAAERDDVTVSPVTVGAGDSPIAIPPLSARGTVVFTVRERTAGLPLLPAKLTFKGVSPTPDPRFKHDFSATLGGEDVLPETFGGTQAGTTGHAAGQGNVVFTASGEGDIQVRPGTYDVYASRGLEYTVQLQRITVAAGGTASASFRLKRAVRTRDAISADFHVHSGRSADTHAALRDRVAAFAGEGVEVMVATDHDKNVDYASFITAFGLESRLRSIIGNEMTGSAPNPPAFPSSIGHINGWPLTVTKDAPRDGAIQDEYVAPNWIYKRLRDAGAEVVQYNHPRAAVSGITTIGIFSNIGCNRCANSIDTPCAVDGDCPAAPAPQECTCVGYQPDRTIATPPNDIMLDSGVLGPGSTPNPDGTTNLDFDVMEIFNGGKVSDVASYRKVRRDWLSLLNQGIFRPVTGVSDSHRITVEHAGWARTFVLGAGDDPASLDVSAFDARVKAGSMSISGGPYIELSARSRSGSAGLGQLLPAPDGTVRLRIKVRAPAWIPVEEVRIIGNGFQVIAYDETTRPRVKNPPAQDFERSGRTSRFRATVRLTLDQDTYFVVEAGAKLPADVGTLPVSPPIVDIVEPEVVPLAVTNPIFVDVDGNDTFDPPGLPVMAASNTATERPAFARVRVEQDLWRRLWMRLTQVASRGTGEALAQRTAGEMTGVTKKEKEEAARKGEYFPLFQFSIPPGAVEQVRKAVEASREPAPGAGTPPGK